MIYTRTHSHIFNEESLIRIDCGSYGAFFEETGLRAGVGEWSQVIAVRHCCKYTTESRQLYSLKVLGQAC